jgi:hypothetical protein
MINNEAHLFEVISRCDTKFMEMIALLRKRGVTPRRRLVSVPDHAVNFPFCAKRSARRSWGFPSKELLDGRLNVHGAMATMQNVDVSTASAGTIENVMFLNRQARERWKTYCF